MSLKEYNWKNRYKSGIDDILKDFFIPALERSKRYYRVAGYFSSDILAAVARGLVKFIDTGEEMRLITGCLLSKEDAEAINKGLKTKEEILYEALQKDLEKNFEKTIINKRLEVLAWLISTGKLKIKIAFQLNEYGQVLPSSEALWHEKFAIFEDEEGNRIHIEGSINETASGWQNNRESFSVHKSWVNGQAGYVEDAYKEFIMLWNGEDDRSLVIDVPEAIKLKLLSFKPDQKPKYDPEETLFKIGRKSIHLWHHQNEALTFWIKNSMSGILAMATGTGKTVAALACISAAIRKKPELKIILILVPTIELANQWEENILSFYPNSKVIVCNTQQKWIPSLIVNLARLDRSPLFIVSTLATARSPKFKELLRKMVLDKPSVRDKILLIVDEVHRIGSEENSKILDFIDAKIGRLGLSATPERFWDKKGTEKIMNYFHNNIYRYTLKQAISDGILSEYYYYIYFVELDKDEREEYKEITKEISKRLRYLHKTTDEIVEVLDLQEIKDPRLQNLLIKRADILKNARKKIEVVDKIVSTKKFKSCLIYCDSNKQVDKILRRIQDKNIVVAKYTSQISLEERRLILKSFEKGDIEMLIAIKCLDEGIDIPHIQSAIFVSSSRNTNEFIQRRGRILRKYTNKIAEIYDLFVLPYPLEDIKLGKVNLTDVDLSILRRELERAYIFADASRNSAEINYKLYNELGKYL